MSQPRKRVAKKAVPETKNETVPSPEQPIQDTTMSEVDSLRAELRRREITLELAKREIAELRSRCASIKEKIEKAVEKVGDILEDFEYNEGLEILTNTRKIIMRQAEDKCADAEKAVDYFRNLRSY